MSSVPDMRPKCGIFKKRPTLWYFCHRVLLGNIEKHVTTLLLSCFMGFQTMYYKHNISDALVYKR